MKKKILSVLLVVTMVSGLVACGKDEAEQQMSALDSMTKAELIQAVIDMQSQLDTVKGEKEQVETILRGTQEEEEPTAAIGTVGDGTGRLTFNSFDSKIIFPQGFEYPGSRQSSNMVNLNLSQNITVAPSSNWFVRCNGTTVEVEHLSGISGTFKVGNIDEIYNRDNLQTEVMSKFFENLPPENITYKNIFLDDTMWGVQATSPTLIDSQDAVLKCGMLGMGEYSLCYVFCYRGEQDVTKDETIITLLNTVKFLGKDLRIE